MHYFDSYFVVCSVSHYYATATNVRYLGRWACKQLYLPVSNSQDKMCAVLSNTAIVKYTAKSFMKVLFVDVPLYTTKCK